MNAPDKSVRKHGAEPKPAGRLPLAYVVRELMADGLMAQADGERVLSVRSRETQVHPLALLAEMNLRSPTPGRELLDIERLTEWLAGKAGLPYQHIDPLRVDFSRVVDVMSSAYATTYSILPIAVAHGEGRAEIDDAGLDALEGAGLVAARYVDHRGAPTQHYPENPNGSPRGVTAVTTPDGRVTILMPHPERVFRAVQYSWRPDEWREDGPWMRLFRNARVWVG